MTDAGTHSADASRRKMLSVIMPARNEEENLRRAYGEVTAVLAALPYDYEVIIIDNDSSDGTGRVAEELCGRDPRWRYLSFSRNFHVEASMTAGFRYARGDAVIVLFSDLQDPPELIPEFTRRWEEGNDIVYGVLRQRTGDPLWKSLSARLLYKIVNSLAEVEITPNATDFRLISRRALDAINQLDERNRYLRGFAHWVGFKRAPLVYDRRPRTAGVSKAPFFYMLNLAANAITCFSIRPLQYFTLAGAGAAGLTAVLSLFYFAAYLLGHAIPGLTTVYLLLLAVIAVQLLGFGALGEYVGRIYVESKRRPLFLVERTINLEAPPLPAPSPAAPGAPPSSSRAA